MSAGRRLGPDGLEVLAQLGDVADEEFVIQVQRAVVGLASRSVTRSRREGLPVDVAATSRVLVALEDLRLRLPKWAHAPVVALSSRRVPGELVTLEELDGRGVVARSTARRWCAEGRVTARKFGRTWVALLEDVEREVTRRQR